MSHRRLVLCSLALAVAAAWPYRHVPELSYCGIDTPVLVEINRPTSVGQLVTCLTREFRDGIEPGIAFYRPWTTLSYVTDAWLWGTGPAGYHVTDVVLFAACAILLLLFLATAGAPLAIATAGTLWFAWHPLAMEVVPVPARRADLWVIAWMLVASTAWRRDGTGARGWRATWIAAAILATLSKESGFVLPLLFLALPSAGRPPVRRLLLGLAVVVPGILLRWLVLKSFGGYGAFSVSGMLDGLRVLVAVSSDFLGGWILVPALGLVILLGRTRARPTVGMTVAWSAAWVLATLLLFCFAGRIGARYLLALLPALAALLVAAWQAGRTARIMATALALLGLTGSPLWTAYPGWDEVSRHMRTWLEQAPPDAASIAVAGLPHDIVLRPPPRHRVRSASVWCDFSLEAGWRLRHGRSPRVIDVAPVQITRLGARYSVRAHREGDAWGFEVDGDGARLAPTYAEAPDIVKTLYVWNGHALQRAE